VTIITTPDGREWYPSTSQDKINCTSCGNVVDTPEEIASFPDGKCPVCGNNWTGTETRSTVISVTMPQALSGET
jgi:predicted RNA-binding Zn-ribbon protein involved in translation (DUF1610 family)